MGKNHKKNIKSKNNCNCNSNGNGNGKCNSKPKPVRKHCACVCEQTFYIPLPELACGTGCGPQQPTVSMWLAPGLVEKCCVQCSSVVPQYN